MIKHIDDINDYVLSLIRNGEQVVFARKTTTVKARWALVDETIKTTIDGTDNVVGIDPVTGNPDWVITNPGGEEYIIKDSVFREYYEPTGLNAGEYRKKVTQLLVPCKETVEFTPTWGGSFVVESGGYFTVNSYNDIAGIQKKAFEQTYEIISKSEEDTNKALTILLNA